MSFAAEPGNRVSLSGVSANSASLRMERMLCGSVPWCATTMLFEGGSNATKTALRIDEVHVTIRLVANRLTTRDQIIVASRQ
jgi:hypothetical protein